MVRTNQAIAASTAAGWVVLGVGSAFPNPLLELGVGAAAIFGGSKVDGMPGAALTGLGAGMAIDGAVRAFARG